MRLIIGSSLLESIEETARASMPEECCGVLYGEIEGEHRQVDRVEAVRNVWAGDRRRRYEIDPRTAFEAFRQARGAGVSVIGFYHSHPDGTATPSSYDVETAWPGKSYLIVAMQDDGDGPRVVGVRAWRLHAGGGEMIEEPIN